MKKLMLLKNKVLAVENENEKIVLQSNKNSNKGTSLYDQMKLVKDVHELSSKFDNKENDFTILYEEVQSNLGI